MSMSWATELADDYLDRWEGLSRRRFQLEERLYERCAQRRDLEANVAFLELRRKQESEAQTFTDIGDMVFSPVAIFRRVVHSTVGQFKDRLRKALSFRASTIPGENQPSIDNGSRSRSVDQQQEVTGCVEDQATDDEIDIDAINEDLATLAHRDQRERAKMLDNEESIVSLGEKIAELISEDDASGYILLSPALGQEVDTALQEITSLESVDDLFERASATSYVFERAPENGQDGYFGDEDNQIYDDATSSVSEDGPWERQWDQERREAAAEYNRANAQNASSVHPQLPSASSSSSSSSPLSSEDAGQAKEQTDGQTSGQTQSTREASPHEIPSPEGNHSSVSNFPSNSPVSNDPSNATSLNRRLDSHQRPPSLVRSSPSSGPMKARRKVANWEKEYRERLVKERLVMATTIVTVYGDLGPSLQAVGMKLFSAGVICWVFYEATSNVMYQRLKVSHAYHLLVLAYYMVFYLFARVLISGWCSLTSTIGYEYFQAIRYRISATLNVDDYSGFIFALGGWGSIAPVVIPLLGMFSFIFVVLSLIAILIVLKCLVNVIFTIEDARINTKVQQKKQEAQREARRENRRSITGRPSGSSTTSSTSGSSASNSSSSNANNTSARNTSRSSRPGIGRSAIGPIGLSRITAALS